MAHTGANNREFEGWKNRQSINMVNPHYSYVIFLVLAGFPPEDYTVNQYNTQQGTDDFTPRKVAMVLCVFQWCPQRHAQRVFP